MMRHICVIIAQAVLRRMDGRCRRNQVSSCLSDDTQILKITVRRFGFSSVCEEFYLSVVNSVPVPQRQRSMSHRHLFSFMALMTSTLVFSVNSPYYQ